MESRRGIGCPPLCGKIHRAYLIGTCRCKCRLADELLVSVEWIGIVIQEEAGRRIRCAGERPLIIKKHCIGLAECDEVRIQQICGDDVRPGAIIGRQRRPVISDSDHAKIPSLIVTVANPAGARPRRLVRA